MNYSEFVTAIKDKLAKRYRVNGWEVKLYRKGDTSEDPDEKKFICATNIKYYGYESEAIGGDFVKVYNEYDNRITWVCRFEIEHLYELFKTRNWKGVYKETDFNIKTVSNNQKTISDIEDYEQIKERLIVKPLNYAKNKQELEGKVFQMEGDFAIVLYCQLQHSEEQLLSVKVRESLLKSWNISASEAINVGLANSNMLYPPRIYMPISDRDIEGFTAETFLKSVVETNFGDIIGRSAFTCCNSPNGAVGFFYPGVKEQISAMVGGADYYVVFTSIQEFHVHICDRTDINLLKQTLDEVNARWPEEMLTEKIYRYSSVSGILKECSVL